MDEAKITLSPQESALVQNAGWLLTKNTIIAKVYQLFGGVSERLKTMTAGLPSSFPPEILAQAPKISRGENYNGLPYLILDYPRLFGKDDVFALRTLFWWGNFFSVTLHLKGCYKARFSPGLASKAAFLYQKRFMLSVDEDEWVHDLYSESYRPLSDGQTELHENLKAPAGHLKLAVALPLTDLKEWNDLPEKLSECYEAVFMALNN